MSKLMEYFNIPSSKIRPHDLGNCRTESHINFLICLFARMREWRVRKNIEIKKRPGGCCPVFVVEHYFFLELLALKLSSDFCGVLPRPFFEPLSPVVLYP